MSEIATLAGGCFWCLEAVYQEVDGVSRVVSGYLGGHVPNPTYEQVCAGVTGHAEAVEITYDPLTVGFRDLLEIFFAIHDPTTLNRQGNDVGTQYRSAIYFHSPEQERIAREVIAELDLPSPVVTEVTPAPTFYPAETYHQNYWRSNPHQGYCLFVVSPKVQKFRAKFAELRRKP